MNPAPDDRPAGFLDRVRRALAALGRKLAAIRAEARERDRRRFRGDETEDEYLDRQT